MRVKMKNVRARFVSLPPRAASVVLAAAISFALVGSCQTEQPEQTEPFEVEASLHRSGNGAEEGLQPGGRISPGDLLFLKIKASETMHVYVLNGDEEGNAFLLFPLPDLDQENPLPAETQHQLPGSLAGTDNYWRVTSAGGTETFLVLASREPLEELEKDFEKFNLAAPERSVMYPRARTETVVQTLRGIGGLTPMEASPQRSTTNQLVEIARSIEKGPNPAHGIWSWEIQLQNPGE